MTLLAMLAGGTLTLMVFPPAAAVLVPVFVLVFAVQHVTGGGEA